MIISSSKNRLANIQKVKKLLKTKKITSATLLMPMVSCYSRISAMKQLKAIYTADDGTIHWNKLFKLNTKSADEIYNTASDIRRTNIQNRKNKKNKKNKIIDKVSIKEVTAAPQDDDANKDMMSFVISQQEYNRKSEMILSRIWAVLSAMQQDVALLADPSILQEANETSNPGT